MRSVETTAVGSLFVLQDSRAGQAFRWMLCSLTITRVVANRVAEISTNLVCLNIIYIYLNLPKTQSINFEEFQ